MKKNWLKKIGFSILILVLFSTALPQSTIWQPGPVNAASLASMQLPVKSNDQDCVVNSAGHLVCPQSNKSVGLNTVVIMPGNYTQISAGRFHTCALASGGLSIDCWGTAFAQTAGAFTTPTLPAGLTYTQVQVGIYFTCGLRSDNTVICWGDNGNGVISQTNSTVSYSQISAGYEHACGINASNNVDCWGSSGNSRLIAPPGPYTYLSAGGAHSCARNTNGSLTCWGAGTTNTGSHPEYGQSIPPDGTFNQVSAGGFHSCGVDTAGVLSCWGLNDNGQTTVPNLPAGLLYTAVSAGENHTCARRSDGSAICWGSNSMGESSVPSANNAYLQVSSGNQYSCGLRQDGSVTCWGKNYITVSGSVKSNGVGLTGVSINYTDSSGTAQFVTTDSAGNYSFSILAGLDGTVTPTKPGYVFTPSTRSYSGSIPAQMAQDYTTDIGANFGDVPFGNLYWRYVEGVYAAGITGGCSTTPKLYCPNSPVTRAQMAVFLLRSIYGKTYSPANATGTVFTDVPLGSFADKWIEQLASEGITSGCGANLYCPNGAVTRGQMAVFLLRAKYGKTYNPPNATGTVFTDVPLGSFADKWIEQLAAEGITSGCAANLYCPNNSVTRGQMAVFLVKTFGLPTP